MSMPSQPKYSLNKKNFFLRTFIVQPTSCNELLHTNQIFINFSFQSTTNQTLKVWLYLKRNVLNLFNLDHYMLNLMAKNIFMIICVKNIKMSCFIRIIIGCHSNYQLWSLNFKLDYF